MPVVVRVRVLEQGEPLTVSTDPHGVESEEGETTFRVNSSEVVRVLVRADLAWGPFAATVKGYVRGRAAMPSVPRSGRVDTRDGGLPPGLGNSLHAGVQELRPRARRAGRPAGH